MSPEGMFAELIAGQIRSAIVSMRVGARCYDAAEISPTASLLEEYVDEAEKRLWFLGSNQSESAGQRHLSAARIREGGGQGARVAVRSSPGDDPRHHRRPPPRRPREKRMDTITLDHHARHRRRFAFTADGSSRPAGPREGGGARRRRRGS